MLKGKNILLAITGSIAAYKSLFLIRLLKTQGANVKVMLSASATAFVTPLSIQALTGEPVHTNLLSCEEEAAMDHISLGKWADLILIAPATANIIAKLNVGIADDLITTTCLVTRAPIILAPAMNMYMWQHPKTQTNVENLTRQGYRFIGPAMGQQACGDSGEGRMEEPEVLLEYLLKQFKAPIFKGKTILITAGPTQEPIDAVRYLSNHSSGKMGYALAKNAIELGARVILISGPSTQVRPYGVEFIAVTTAKEMYDAVMSHIRDTDIFIGAAAVADYRYIAPQQEKIKKLEATLTLTFEKNPDILEAVSNLENKPYTVGFAAETHHLLKYAKTKLSKKGCDLIAANQVSSTIGFNQSHNALWILQNGEPDVEISFNTKEKIAASLLVIIHQRLMKTKNHQELSAI